MRFDLRKFSREVHKLAVKKGWYKPAKTDIEALALVSCEVAEAIEEIRDAKQPIYFKEAKGFPPTGKYGNKLRDRDRVASGEKPEGELIELADVVIRLLDYCEHKKYDLVEAMEMKHAYNKTRPHRHGGKKA